MDLCSTSRHSRVMESDVLIVGGGLNGPALALALAQGGLSVTVVDARPAPARAETGFDGRAYALAIASQRLLAAVGVWRRMADKAQPILKVVASDGRAGEGPAPFFLTFDAAEIEEGPMGYMAEDRFLYAAFLEAMEEQPGLRLVSGQTAVALGDFVKLGFEQDVQIWRNKARIDNPLLVEEDGPVYQLRRWYEQFYVDVADVTPDMVDRFEFEFDTTRPREAWSREVQENLAANIVPVVARSSGPSE